MFILIHKQDDKSKITQYNCYKISQEQKASL